VLDAWCYHPQLADVIALARAVPQATIVMCHVGGVLGYGAYAGKKDEVHAAWRGNMAELATCPNVSVKLAGMLNRGAALNFRELPAPPNSECVSASKGDPTPSVYQRLDLSIRIPSSGGVPVGADGDPITMLIFTAVSEC
jgi:hypothetical protein